MRTLRLPLLVIISFALGAVAFTWPLVKNLSSSVVNTGDPVLNAWILSWNAHALAHDVTGFFHANIFFPHPDTLAYSEHLAGLMPLAAPLLWVGLTPISVANICLLASFVVAGLGMFLLAREVSGHNLASWLAAFLYAFCPFSFAQLGHLQVLYHGWWPLCLWGLILFIERGGSWRHGLIATVAFLMLALSNGYFLYFGFIGVVVWALIYLPFRNVSDYRKVVVRGMVLAALTLVMMSPFIMAYLRVDQMKSLERDPSEIAKYSARTDHYFAVPETSLMHRWWGDKPMAREGVLWPGTMIAVLAVAGLGFKPHHRAKWLGVALIVVGVGLSRGTRGELFELLGDVLPGFAGLRVPTRAMVLAYCGAAMLAALGGAGLMRVIAKPARYAVLAVILVVHIFDVNETPLKWMRVGDQPTAIDQWLAGAPRGPVVWLPMHSEQNIFGECIRMLRSHAHWNPMVNGYSGMWPATYWENQAIINEFPSTESLARLRELGVRYILVQGHRYSGPKLEALKEAAANTPGLRLVYTDNIGLVYEQP